MDDLKERMALAQEFMDGMAAQPVEPTTVGEFMQKVYSDAAAQPVEGPRDYEVGEVVQVNHPRYHGTGHYQTYEAARPRMIGVILQHGEVRWYEADTVSKLTAAPVEGVERVTDDAPARVEPTRCRHCGFIREGHMAFARCIGGSTRWDPAAQPAKVTDDRPAEPQTAYMKRKSMSMEEQLSAAETRIEVLEAALRDARYYLAMFGHDGCVDAVDAALAAPSGDTK